MRIPDVRVWLTALAFVGLACGPQRFHHPDMGMCGPGSCGYQSRCFSEGAVRANDGVCQACNAGRWVAASGCRECASHACCGGKMGMPSPCPFHPEHPPRR